MRKPHPGPPSRLPWLCRLQRAETPTPIAVWWPSIWKRNVNGGAGSVGNRKVKDAANDGYTLLHVWNGILLNKLFGTSDVGLEDFEVMNTTVTDEHNGWFVSKNAPYKTLAEVVAYSKTKKPVNFATDIGSLSHLTEVKFIEVSGAKLNIVDAGGAAEKVKALLGGQLDIMFTQVGAVQSYLKSGDFVPLGIMSEKRSKLAPNIPTFKEQGYDLVYKKPLIMLAPKGTDMAIVDKMNKAIAKVQANPEFVAELAQKTMFIPTNMTRDETIKYYAELNKTYKETIDKYKATLKK